MPPLVFISYSKSDGKWKDLLVRQLGVLEQQKLIRVWEDQRIPLGEDWFPDLEGALAAAKVAVLLVSADFLTTQFILAEEVPRLLARRRGEGLIVVPVIVRHCLWEKVSWLKEIQVFKKGKVLSRCSEEEAEAELKEIAAEILRAVSPASPAPAATHSQPDVWISRLPKTGKALFGRESELGLLNRAWEDSGTNVVSLVAWGGVGKSALINHWLASLARKGYPGASRVYGWSFYSQGTSEPAASSDRFMEAVLKRFGDHKPGSSPWDWGERLVGYLRHERVLLVLDGLEPLQHPPGPEEGCLKDPALEVLLRGLASLNPGLCVITTRLPIADLASFEGETVQSPSLEHLSPEAGARLLRAYGVKGDRAELMQASEEFGGHCLGLVLLGSYLRDIYGGEVRHRVEIMDALHTDHARRMMAVYERWFGDGPERAVLRLMGLFRSPATKGAIGALRAAPVIEGLTEPFQGIDAKSWRRTLSTLRRARLLMEANPQQPDNLDAHPLVREHFGERLREENPTAWREAHNRLYEHFTAIAPPHPETLGDLAPLYAAVVHGCKAGRHSEVLQKVYWERILREKEYFATEKLGAFGSDLAVLAQFFESPWDKLVEGLSTEDHAFLLHRVGLCLRALGFVSEAADLLASALEARLAQGALKRAAITAGNLSEVFLALGALPQALEFGRKGVKLAEESRDRVERIINNATLADALHQAGRVAEAEQVFGFAEDLQQEEEAQFPLLYSVEGFRLCDLLLEQGKFLEVEQRAAQTLKWAEARKVLLSIALDHLSLGRAAIRKALSEGGNDFSQAAEHLDEAVKGLKDAGTQHHLPRGLTARADLLRRKGSLDQARSDLKDALSVAARGGMRLYEADCHLHFARLHLSAGDLTSARESWSEAKRLIEAMGYHRRDTDLRDLARSLN